MDRVTIAEAIARPLLAGVFIYGGIEAIRRPAPKAEVAEPVLAQLSSATGLDQERLVRINGVAQVAAGACLALGILPRPAAVVLAASIVPTTLAGHRFWSQDDAAATRNHRIHFLKNGAVLGGLIFAATSTGGRPSIPWRARKAVEHAVETTGEAIESLRHAG
jgi:putative oxidoreductase